MTPKAEAVYDAALQLSAEEREWLGHHIFRSIDNHPDLVTPEEVEEIERRVEDFRQGRVKGIPAEDAINGILNRLADRKRH